jgi:hypothetical protein
MPLMGLMMELQSVIGTERLLGVGWCDLFAFDDFEGTCCLAIMKLTF